MEKEEEKRGRLSRAVKQLAPPPPTPSIAYLAASAVLLFHAVASGTSVAVGKPPLLSPSRSQPSDDDVSASD
jgi:hypothetical protein